MALLIRVSFLLLTIHFADPQHMRYKPWGGETLTISYSLANGHGFASPYVHYPFVTAWLAPVYPWLLSLGQRLFGVRGDSLILFSQLVNAFFSSMTCYVVCLLGTKVFGEVVGVTSAWIWAALPVAVVMPIEWIWDQSLSAFLLCLLLYLTYRVRETSSPLNWSGYGLLWGAAALTNPSLCVLLPFLAIWLWYERRKEGLPSSALLGRVSLFFVLAVLPWTLRNYFEVGGLFFVKSNFGLELWLGNNAQVKNGFSLEYFPLNYYPEYRRLVLTNESFYSQLKEREALAFIRSNPRTFLRLCDSRFVDTWTGMYDTHDDTYVQPLGLGAVYFWYNLCFSIASFAGLVAALWSKKIRKVWPFALALAVFPIPYYLVHTSLRYRHPIDPILTILAVYGAVQLLAFIAERLRLSPVPVVAQSN